MTENIIPAAYSLIENIGKGGFARTYLCKTESDGKCIVKHFSVPSADKKYIELATLEAKVLQKLNHKRIPRFIDFHTVQNDENIEMFLVQDYVEARNLKQVIKSGRHFNEEEVINIALQVIKILEYLHGFLPQIIHRDIKPENILLAENDIVYLIDFGAVKEKLTYFRLSESGISTIIGTQGYLPLEQFEGKPIPGSDIYSLGLTLVYLLSHLEPLQLPKDGLNFNFNNKVNISENFSLVLEKMVNPDWKRRYRNIIPLKRDILALKKQDRRLKNKKLPVDDIKGLILPKLRENEIVLWQHKPGFYTLVRENYSVMVLPVAILPVFLAFMVTIIYFLGQNIIFLTLYILVILLLIFLNTARAVLYSAWETFKEIKNKTKTLYFITNQRIISSQGPDNKNFRFLTGSDLKDLVMEKKEYRDGSGALVFFTLVEDKRASEKVLPPLKKNIIFQINGIKDVRRAEKLIMNILNHS
jgi:serine/threonine protein kinase